MQCKKHICPMREHCFDKTVVAVNRNHLHFKHMCVPLKQKWEFDSYWKRPYWWKLWKACHRAVDIQQRATFTWCRPFVDIWCFSSDPCHSCVILTAILTWYWQYQARHQAKPRRGFLFIFMVSNRNAYHHPLEPHNAVICSRVSSNICTYAKTMQSSFSQRKMNTKTRPNKCAMQSFQLGVSLQPLPNAQVWMKRKHIDVHHHTLMHLKPQGKWSLKQNPSIEFCSCLKMLMTSAYYASNSSKPPFFHISFTNDPCHPWQHSLANMLGKDGKDLQ